MSQIVRTSGGDRICLVDDQGARWRVHDLQWKPRAVLLPPSSRANYRVFVSEQGVKRIHQFVPGEDRTLAAEQLTWQLTSAAYLGHGSFDASEHAPR